MKKKKNLLQSLKLLFTYSFINLVAILIGFFISINISSILGQTGDWSVLSSGILVAMCEILNKIVYADKKKIKKNYFLKKINFP